MPFFLTRFKTNQAGQVVVLFALMLVPMCAVCGFCLDYQTKLQRTLKVQAVLDSAVLAAARAKQTGASDSQVKSVLINFVTPQIAQMPGLSCTTPTVTLSSTDEQIVTDIECKQGTTLMSMIGQETMPFGVDSASDYAIGHLDVAFMFDVSDSMRSGNRLVDLKVAAKEAIDILLPSTASSEATKNTRIAMASYGSTLNAGQYFEQVTGVPATRTYSDTFETEIQDSEIKRGSRFREMAIELYDADTNAKISRLGPGAVIKVDPSALDNMTIVVSLRPAHTLYDDLESIRFELSGQVTTDKDEDVPPYSLYGDSGSGDVEGAPWTSGNYTLRIRAYDENGARGSKLFDEDIDFELFVDGDTRTTSIEHTLTSTCVWERDGNEAFTDAPPSAGNYFAHHKAWYRPFSAYAAGGVWDVGFNQSGEQRATGSSCETPPPVELTNNRTTLTNYISTLTSKGSTAGHLGVAWTWYLISDRWSAIFDGTATPAGFDNSEIKKAVVLMTDGEFNTRGYLYQGNSTEQAQKICDNMKLKHIEIYSVAFNAPTAGQEILKYCASDPSFYHESDTAEELKRAYKDIAVSLSELRLSK